MRESGNTGAGRKPGSVEDNHSSGTVVTDCLKQPTRECVRNRRWEHPNTPSGALCVALLPYLVLLRAGFTVPRTVTSRAVRSYRTFSPLPAFVNEDGRYIFCGTFHGLAPPRCYLAPCPKEPGLSSVTQRVTAIAWPTPAFPAASLLFFKLQHTGI